MNIINKINTIINSTYKKSVYTKLSLAELITFYYNEFSLGLDGLAKYIYNSKTVDKDKDLDSINKFVGFDIRQSGIENVEEYPLFYRGSNHMYPIMLVKPGTRTAKDTSNLYTLFMSEYLTSWRKWPARNRSIIMTDSYTSAYNYSKSKDEVTNNGRVYYVIPPNDAVLCISPTQDVWDSFKKFNITTVGNGCAGIPVFNYLVTNLLEMFSYFNVLSACNEEIYDIFNNSSHLNEMNDWIIGNDRDANTTVFYLSKNSNKKEINDIINKMDTFFKDKTLNKKKEEIFFNYFSRFIYDTDKTAVFKRIFHSYKANGFNFIRAIDEMLDPVSNGYRKKTYSQFKSTIKPGFSEIWTQSQCLFIEDIENFGKIFIKDYIKRVLKYEHIK